MCDSPLFFFAMYLHFLCSNLYKHCFQGAVGAPLSEKDSKYIIGLYRTPVKLIAGGERTKLHREVADRQMRSISSLLMERRRSFGVRSATLRRRAPSSCLLLVVMLWGKSKHVCYGGTDFFCTLYFIVEGRSICYYEKLHYC